MNDLEYKKQMNIMKAIVRKRLIALSKYSAEVLVDILSNHLVTNGHISDIRVTNDENYLKAVDRAIENALKLK